MSCYIDHRNKVFIQCILYYAWLNHFSLQMSCYIDHRSMLFLQCVFCYARLNFLLLKMSCYIDHRSMVSRLYVLFCELSIYCFCQRISRTVHKCNFSYLFILKYNLMQKLTISYIYTLSFRHRILRAFYLKILTKLS